MTKDRYEVYGIVNCPFCTRAIDLLQSKGLEYSYYPLDSMIQNESRRIMDEAGMKTVPIIYCNRELVGGFTELRIKFEELEDG